MRDISRQLLVIAATLIFGSQTPTPLFPDYSFVDARGHRKVRRVSDQSTRKRKAQKAARKVQRGRR